MRRLAPRPRSLPVRPAFALLLALATVLPAAAQRAQGRPVPSATAARCGDAVAWRPDVGTALAEANEKGLPVFWYVATVPGTPMDRKDAVDLAVRAGMFSMPDVVELLNRRTIPVATRTLPRRPRGARAAPSAEGGALDPFAAFDVKAGAFVEPGFVLIRPDGSAFFKLDRLTTQHELWLTALLDRELSRAGFDLAPKDAQAIAGGLVDDVSKLELLLKNGGAAATLRAIEKFALDEDGLEADRRNRLALVRGKALARMGDAAGARRALESAAPSAEATTELALLALREERDAVAADLLKSIPEGPRADEARWLSGVAQWRLGGRTEALATWRALAAERADAPFGWKAAAEAEGFGPFVRGFEEHGYLRPDALTDRPEGTQVARTEADAGWLARRGVDYLLRMQGPDGGFEDSYYDFGGRDSLPDVYVAVTALAARALLEWRALDPERIDAAVKKAFAYAADESRCASKNTQERMWAHAYRILLCCRMLDVGVGDAAKTKEKLAELVALSEGRQLAKGAWAHEYPNPFVTALALQSLAEAKARGARIDAAKFDSGAHALLSTRDDEGNYSYGFPGKGDSDVFSAGRNPQAELALKLAKLSDDAKVAAALAKSFAHHDAYEAVRKYDDHAPPHRIGGFFFFYDQMHRVDAILSLADPMKRAELLKKQREILLRIPEIDGRFVDSHELGKAYGAAAGLICLKGTTPVER